MKGKVQSISGRNIHVRGLVQGVGFRPFVYRIAIENHLKGWVENRNDGVIIHVEGLDEHLDIFEKQIVSKAPPASQIREFRTVVSELEGHDSFKIIKSANQSSEITEVSPDIAVCDECLEDMKSQSHRIDYPFINCTNCGPRFTIIRDLPYDRDKTTMDVFPMCPQCRKEYENVIDRRFHAQPIACNQCGPEYELQIGELNFSLLPDILNKAASLLDEGKILAIKGMGGFHLACDAFNNQSVKLLRERKMREGKPFAVMFADVESVRISMELNEAEEALLKSWRRPIVLLKNKADISSLPESVSNGFHTSGVMLPYMPIHYLLFEKLHTRAVVLTSGNKTDEPIVIDNDIAKIELSQLADAFLFYNREIYNRTDDSVTFIAGNEPRLIRRSRGYAPSPVYLNLQTEGIFAAGAELVNCFCVGRGSQAFLSQHIGDLKNIETLEFYQESVKRFNRLFRIKPDLIACDLHPDYLSTRFAEEFSKHNGDIPVYMTQHHHAHIASCMAENGLDEKVIGISFDGVGLGDDGNIWGGEILLCDLSSYERLTHLEYIPQPGGDKATKEPWRMAVSYLYHAYGDDIFKLKLPFLSAFPKHDLEIVISAIRNSINTPLTSSMGRLFDAVSAMTGLCTISSFHAEAPMRLEHAIKQSVSESYPFKTSDIIESTSMIRGIAEDILNRNPVSYISSKFHNTIKNMILESVNQVHLKRGISKVALSGGSFQNKYLLESTEKELIAQGFKVYSQKSIPTNDGGIALGQLAIAAKHRELLISG